jgi:hypothetical protein
MENLKHTKGMYTDLKVEKPKEGDKVLIGVDPFVSQYPKLMEVSEDEETGYFDAEVLFEKDNLFWTKHSSKNFENMHVIGYKFAREIQPKAVEFSEVQKAYLKEKFNVNV